MHRAGLFQFVFFNNFNIRFVLFGVEAMRNDRRNVLARSTSTHLSKLL